MTAAADRPFLIAQITDMHVVEPGTRLQGEIDTNGAMARCAARLAGLDPQPDVLVITGDLTDTGTPAAYAHLREMLAPLRMPVYVLPGNHDRREAMRAAFAGTGALPADDGQPFLQYAVEGWPLRLVVLDTVEEGRTGGRLCAARLGWLADRLAEQPGRPTLIALHHPPFDTGIPFMDRIGLDGRDGLADVVARHPNVELVICGHVHRAVQTRFAGTLASICPSTAHQILLTFDPDRPDAWVPEPPAFHLHAWRPGGGLVTHLVPVESPGPPRGMHG